MMDSELDHSIDIRSAHRIPASPTLRPFRSLVGELRMATLTMPRNGKDHHSDYPTFRTYDPATYIFPAFGTPEMIFLSLFPQYFLIVFLMVKAKLTESQSLYSWSFLTRNTLI